MASQPITDLQTQLRACEMLTAFLGEREANEYFKPRVFNGYITALMYNDTPTPEKGEKLLYLEKSGALSLTGMPNTLPMSNRYRIDLLDMGKLREAICTYQHPGLTVEGAPKPKRQTAPVPVRPRA
ncbi:MAG: hypothetical protein EBR02_06135 [Alphaproteobacteria bacterium]|nr:hypothetical protein [Alphaproteobacteria bacterium]